MLKLPASNDYSWTPNLSLPSSKDQRLLYSRASNQDKPKLSQGVHRRLLSTDINYQLNISSLPTPSANQQVHQKPISTPSSLQSHTPQHNTVFSKTGIVVGGGRKTSLEYGTLNSMRKNTTERCGSQF